MVLTVFVVLWDDEEDFVDTIETPGVVEGLYFSE